MLKFFFEGDDFFKALAHSLETATQSIEIEIYYFASDELGWRFAEILKKKSQEKLSVRVIYDAAGCRTTSSSLFESLRESGVELKAYNPFFSSKNHAFHRTHRKMMIIDDSVCFLGGFNLAAEYSQEFSDEMAWRDTGVRIEDENLVSCMRKCFEKNWHPIGFGNFKNNVEAPHWEKSNHHLVPYNGWYRRNFIRGEYFKGILNATQKVFITNPYFIPDRPLRRALRRAALAGVEVCILTAGISDAKVVKWAGQATYSLLLEAGVRIFEYQNRFIHAKCAVIDSQWFTVGTSNFDHFSFFLNLEINLFGKDPKEAKILEDQFIIDLGHSKEIKKVQWEKRPWWMKWRERFFYFFRKWL